ncbi:hypothetical protein LTR95_002226 [Oleoguttula sp. CCFEE 5521]
MSPFSSSPTEGGLNGHGIVYTAQDQSLCTLSRMHTIKQPAKIGHECHDHATPEENLIAEQLAHVSLTRQGLPSEPSNLEIGLRSAFDLKYIDVYAVDDTREKYDTAVENLRKAKSGELQECKKCLQEKVAALRKEVGFSGHGSRDDMLKAVRPGFQLAYAILQDPSQLAFWHGLMVAGRDFDCHAITEHPQRTFYAKDALTASEQEETLEWLERLGNCVFIAFEVLDPNEVGETWYQPMNFVEVPETDEKYCEELREWAAVSRLPARGRQIYAHIALDRTSLLRPCLAWQQMKITDLQKAWFHIATTLLHELAHAAVNFAYHGRLRKGCRVSQVFFMEEPCAEVGFAYETYVFSGMPHVRDYGPEMRVKFNSWPSQAVCRQYEEQTEEGLIKGITERGDVPENTSYFRTPWDEVSRFFKASFWDANEEDRKRMHLKLATCCGYEVSPEAADKARGESKKNKCQHAKEVLEVEGVTA